VRIERIRISNFLSFGPDVRVPLAHAGLTLIEGENRDDVTAASNGCGKSAIIEALVWCLYGITLRGYEGDDVISKRAGKDCLVRTQLTLAAKAYTVMRTRKHAEYKTTLRLYRGKTDISAGTMDATQELIDRLLQMHATTFLNSVVFGQSAAYRFSLLTDKQQKEILDEAIGTSQYAAACDLARAKHRALELERKTLQPNIATLTNVMQTYAETIAEMKVKLAAQAAQFRQKRQALKSRIVAIKAALPVVPAATPEPPKPTATDPELQRLFALAMRANDRAHDSLDATAQALQQHKAAKICTQCQQPIPQAEYAAQLQQLKTKHHTCTKTATASTLAVEQQEQVLKQHALTDTQRRRTHEAWQAAQRKRDDQRLRRDAARRELKQAKRELEDPSNSLTAACAILQDVLATSTIKRDQHASELTTAQARLAEVARLADQYSFWIEGFGDKGIRPLLLENALPFLNQKAATISQTLSDGNLLVEFRTQTELKSGKQAERFEVAVTNKFGAGNYKGNSAGEKAKIDLIVGLSLQALVSARAAPSNVIFFDEPFEALDDTATDHVITLLTETFGKHESIFVITHNEALKTYFPHSLTVIKEAGQSRIA
jgi:DNA repair exonuclease SbcCD ATPase subunit